MNVIKYFECGICGAVYDNEEEAKSCEICHCGASRIVSVGYTKNSGRIRRFFKSNSYPDEIVVEMTDGKRAVFKPAGSVT